jgi:hypothetical protein
MGPGGPTPAKGLFLFGSPAFRLEISANVTQISRIDDAGTNLYSICKGVRPAVEAVPGEVVEVLVIKKMER